jgi:hypothetical protein
LHSRQGRIEWIKTSRGEFIDIHRELHLYDDVLTFFKTIEREGDRKRYCNGANAGGRWIYQIYSKEFILMLARVINSLAESSQKGGDVLEVMSGDGQLTSFLRPYIHTNIIATDAKTSRDNIAFPKWVEQIDAVDAVTKYAPAVVLMCWEPYYSDIGVKITDKDIPTVWIGDPTSCAVSSGLDGIEHRVVKSPYLLGRQDNFSEGTFRTVMWVFNAGKESSR